MYNENATTYTPDAWVIVRIVNNIAQEVTYKVFAQWHGGYAQGESWKINSGIVKVDVEDNCYLFKGHSGSVYRCHKNNYRTTGYGSSVLSSMLKDAEVISHVKVEVLEDCDWSQVDYGT